MAYPYGYGFFNFNSVIQQWNALGLFDIILPIVLIFTVVFAILQRTRILGARREIDAIIALTIGFFSVSNPQVTSFLLPLFQNFAVGISMVLVGLLFMGLVLPRRYPFKWNLAFAGFGIVIFFWVISRASSYYFDNSLIFSSAWWLANSWWIIPLVMFAILIAIVVSSSGPPDIRHLEKFPKEIQDMFVRPWHTRQMEMERLRDPYSSDLNDWA